jgi:hypothetical protein
VDLGGIEPSNRGGYDAMDLVIDVSAEGTI